MKRFQLRLALKILVTAAALAWFFSTARPGVLLDRLAGIRWWIIAPAFLVNTLWVVPSAFRWMGIARLGGFRLTFRASARYYVIGSFFNAFLPTGNGGDIVRGFLASRECGFPLGGIMGTVLVERLIGLFVSLSFVLITGFALVSGAVLPINVLVSAAILLACLTAAGAALKSRACRNLLKSILLKMRFRSFHDSARNAARVIDACWKNPAALGSAAALSFVNQLVPIVSGAMTAMAIPGFDAPFHAFLVVIPLSFITVLLPSIGGVGVREAGFILFFGWFGVSAESAAVFGIIRLLFTWAFAFAGAGLYILRRREERGISVPSILKSMQTEAPSIR